MGKTINHYRGQAQWVCHAARGMPPPATPTGDRRGGRRPMRVGTKEIPPGSPRWGFLGFFNLDFNEPGWMIGTFVLNVTSSGTRDDEKGRRTIAPESVLFNAGDKAMERMNSE